MIRATTAQHRVCQHSDANRIQNSDAKRLLIHQTKHAACGTHISGQSHATRDCTSSKRSCHSDVFRLSCSALSDSCWQHVPSYAPQSSQQRSQ